MAKITVLLLLLVASSAVLVPGANAVELQEVEIHDLLVLYKLPRGLLPVNVANYTFSPPSSNSSIDGSFSVNLSTPCYVHFADQLVYYGREITGKVGYGVVRNATGIQAKKLFLWLQVTGIVVGRGQDEGFVEFFVGSLSKKLPAKEFETVPACGSEVTLELPCPSTSATQFM